MKAGISPSFPEEVEEAEALFIATICREMKWSFEEFINQPAWLIETISLQISAEKTENNPDNNNQKNETT